MSRSVEYIERIEKEHAEMLKLLKNINGVSSNFPSWFFEELDYYPDSNDLMPSLDERLERLIWFVSILWCYV